MPSRRDILAAGSAGLIWAGVPFGAAGQKRSDTAHSFQTDGGTLTVHPVMHASFVMETPERVIYNDPIGDPAAYADFPPPDLILITHQHSDHYKPETLSALVEEKTRLITNPAVHDMLPEELRARTTALANGQGARLGDLSIQAIPAYNTTEGRLQYHPEGRDNGYILGIDGFRVYIAGDTEDIPEMRALQDIDLAFLPMNLPYTMTVKQAASAVAAFTPRWVYPYHYRGSDVDRFAELVDEGDSGTKVLRGPWYSSG